VPVRGGPRDDLDELGPLDIEQARQLRLQSRVTLRRDVVFYLLLRHLRAAGRGMPPVAAAVASVAAAVASITAAGGCAAAVASVAMTVTIAQECCWLSHGDARRAA